MKRLISYGFLFLSGLIIGLLLLWKSENSYRSEQIDIITNGIKNVQKLVVTEAYFSEIYNYQEADSYFFETIEFEKKAILLINAKVQVAYDLKQMKIEIDSIHKKLLIQNIPEPEVTIIPEFKYYDIQQSLWNTFSKDDLNKIQALGIEKIQKQMAVAQTEQQARKQLLENLQNLLQLTQLVGWTVEDQTGTSIFSEIKSFSK